MHVFLYCLSNAVSSVIEHMQLDTGLDMVDKAGVVEKSEQVKNDLVVKQTYIPIYMKHEIMFYCIMIHDRHEFNWYTRLKACRLENHVSTYSRQHKIEMDSLINWINIRLRCISALLYWHTRVVKLYLDVHIYPLLMFYYV